MGMPVVTVASGGMPVMEVPGGQGTPVYEAGNGKGVPVTKVLNGGMPVVYVGAGGGPALITVADDFNRANGAMGSNWSALAGFNGLQIVGNAAGGTVSGQNHSYWKTPLVSANQWAQCRFSNLGSNGHFLALLLRLANVTTSPTGYCIFISVTSGIYLYRFDAGSLINTTLGWTNPAVTTNDVIRVNVIGNQFEMFQNGLSRGKITENTYATGPYIGAGARDAADKLLDDWTGGEL